MTASATKAIKQIQTTVVDNNDKKIISLLNEVGAQVNVFAHAGDTVDTVDENISKAKSELAAEIQAIKAKYGLVIDQERKEKKLINQLKNDTKKELIISLHHYARLR